MTDPLTPEIQKQFDDYFDMFATPGWKQFTRDLQESLLNDQKSAISRCTTSDKWFEERGMQARTLKILAFEAALRAQYEQLTNPVVEEEGNPLEDY